MGKEKRRVSHSFWKETKGRQLLKARDFREKKEKRWEKGKGKKRESIWGFRLFRARQVLTLKRGGWGGEVRNRTVEQKL